MSNIEYYLNKKFWKIDSYFTGGHRKNPLYFCLLIILAILIFLSIKFKIDIPIDTLNWTFSTTAQVLVGLIGLLAVAVVFKLQVITNQEDKLIILAESGNPYTWLSDKLRGKLYLSGTELLDTFNKILETEHPTEQNIYIIKKKLEDIALSRKLTKDYIIEFTVLTSFIIILSLFLLIISKYLFSIYLGLPALYIIVILAGYSFTLAIKGILYNVITR